MINQGRSAGVHAVLSTQSLADISNKGGKDLLGQVLNNCNNFLIQRQNNPEDAQILANIIGTENNFQITSQLSADDLPPVGSIRSTKEFIVHPDEIKRLKLGETILVNKQEFEVTRMMGKVGEI